jgi:hypothetical protein
MSYNTTTGSELFSSMIIMFLRSVLLLFLFFLLTSMYAFSQGKTITIDGREAILKPNGKWEYVKKTKVEPPAKTADCQYSKNHIDNLKGTTIKILEREKLVSHTPEELKKVFTDREYISLDAYLSNYNDHFALFIKIAISTNNPHAAYGSIFKDSQLILKLNNGQTITLYSGQSESGNVDYLNDKTTYLTFFELNEAAMELLPSGELEMMRLYWSKGYEDYPIANRDFFIRQIQCVK